MPQSSLKRAALWSSVAAMTGLILSYWLGWNCIPFALLAMVAGFFAGFLPMPDSDLGGDQTPKALAATLSDIRRWITATIIAVFLSPLYFMCVRWVEDVAFRQRVHDVGEVIKNCRGAGECRVVCGKAIVWDLRNDARSAAHERVPSDLRATPKDREVTIFVVVQERIFETGTYEISRQSAFTGYVEVAVVAWPSKKMLGYKLIADAPPQNREVIYAPEYPEDSGELVADWINSLRRTTVADVVKADAQLAASAQAQAEAVVQGAREKEKLEQLQREEREAELRAEEEAVRLREEAMEAFRFKVFQEITASNEASERAAREQEKKTQAQKELDMADKTAQDAAASRSKAAATKLAAAKSIVDKNLTAAKRRLQEIVDSYGDTDAGMEATKILKELSP